MNLVVQGPALAPGDLDALALLVKPRDVREIAPHAFRMLGAMKNEGVAPLCEARRIDHAWVPEGRRFADLKLLAMDMDSTLITIECIDELGDLAGRKDEIAAITEQAMRGEVEYRESLRRRVAALAGLPEDSLERIYEERLRLTPGAEALIAACKKHGVKLLLVSGGFTFFTERLKKRLGLDYTISNVLEVKGGKLSGALVGDIVDAEAKAAKFRSVLRELNAPKDQSVAMGDGANDLKMMAEAGYSIAFRAKPVVRAQASCALNWSGLDAVPNLFE
ncbi:MAG: phosphoserine phosphatase SerB [Burkholderiales bacterium]|jgi:phosphoserine phosphatase|nr:phosphoserine phosphatase SerB [Burkholderiales bacterium]